MNHTRLRQPPRFHPAHQTGFSLVELIVSMVIGLTVVGAALAMYVSSGFSGRGSTALSQMTEDASIALGLLRTQVAMAGYGNPTGVDANGLLTKEYTGTAIFGCTGGPTATTAASDLGSMACNNDDSKPDSVVVLYQADVSNTVPTSTSEATDCLGAGITPTGTLSLAENRYFVDGSTLSCLGKSAGSAATSQPLVENIKDLKITYGVARTKVVGTTTVTSGVAERYLTAKQISVSGKSAALWNQVTSARICILVSSESNVLDEPASYYDCNGTQITPAANSTDKHLYRAFTTTVVLQNRIN